MANFGRQGQQTFTKLAQFNCNISILKVPSHEFCRALPQFQVLKTAVGVTKINILKFFKRHLKELGEHYHVLKNLFKIRIISAPKLSLKFCDCRCFLLLPPTQASIKALCRDLSATSSIPSGTSALCRYCFHRLGSKASHLFALLWRP